jgi:anti-anti-sigma factor
MSGEITPASAKVVTGPDGSVTVLLTGDFDIASAAILEEALVNATEPLPEASAVVVDMTNVMFFESTSVVVLMRAFHMYADRGVAMRIVHASGLVERVLRLTGVYGMLAADPSMEPVAQPE